MSYTEEYEAHVEGVNGRKHKIVIGVEFDVEYVTLGRTEYWGSVEYMPPEPMIVDEGVTYAYMKRNNICREIDPGSEVAAEALEQFIDNYDMYGREWD